MTPAEFTFFRDVQIKPKWGWPATFSCNSKGEVWPSKRFGLTPERERAHMEGVRALLDTDEAVWDRLMDVNAKGVFLCSQAAARRMIAQGGGGRIINNASGAGKIAPGKGVPLGAYAASKHAVVGLTRQMGLELSSHGILVNCVCAGIVDTPMWELIDREIARLEGAPVGSVKARAVASVPLGRIQKPEDVANVVAFLASSDASYVTGQTYNASGGLLPY